MYVCMHNVKKIAKRILAAPVGREELKVGGEILSWGRDEEHLPAEDEVRKEPMCTRSTKKANEAKLREGGSAEGRKDGEKAGKERKDREDGKSSEESESRTNISVIMFFSMFVSMLALLTSLHPLSSHHCHHLGMFLL